jgi:hypothetical protein
MYLYFDASLVGRSVWKLAGGAIRPAAGFGRLKKLPKSTTTELSV